MSSIPETKKDELPFQIPETKEPLYGISYNWCNTEVPKKFFVVQSDLAKLGLCIQKWMLDKWMKARDSKCFGCYICNGDLKKYLDKPREVDLAWCDAPGGHRAENTATPEKFWTMQAQVKNSQYNDVFFEICPARWIPSSMTDPFGFTLQLKYTDTFWSSRKLTEEQLTKFLKDGLIV